MGNHYFVLLMKQSNPTKLLTLGVEVALVEVCVKTVGTDFSGNIHRKCPILFPDFFLPDRMTTNHCQITWSTSFKTRWYYWIDACSTIAGEQIWRSRQNCGAVQIATNRRNFLKLINTVLISSFIHQIRFETCLFAIKWLIAHCLDTQIHLCDHVTL